MVVFHDRFAVLMGDIRRAVLRCLCRDGKLTLEEKVRHAEGMAGAAAVIHGLDVGLECLRIGITRMFTIWP